MKLVTKSRFAELCNVDRSAVSKWIKAGLISADALVGTGRTARINLDLARQQLARRRDAGQSCGNGLKTRLRADPPARPTSEPGSPPEAIPALVSQPVSMQRPDFLDPLDERIKAGKLEGIERANRKAAEEEEARVGRYIEAAAARREMARIAGSMLEVLEQALDTFAAATAERFQVPQRDVLHLFKTEFRKVRLKAAEAHARRAEAHFRTVAPENEPEPPAPPEGGAADPEELE